MFGKWKLYLIVRKTEAPHKRDNIILIINYQIGTEEKLSNKVRSLKTPTRLVANTVPQISHRSKMTLISFCSYFLPAKYHNTLNAQQCLDKILL